MTPVGQGAAPMGPADAVAGANRVMRRHYLILEATLIDDGVRYMAHAPIVAAARTNRLFALTR